jgi:hypothetical protein
MDREFLYKLVRAVIFPFRFAYLIVYQWRMNRSRASYLAAHAPAPPPPEHSEE